MAEARVNLRRTHAPGGGESTAERITKSLGELLPKRRLARIAFPLMLREPRLPPVQCSDTSSPLSASSETPSSPITVVLRRRRPRLRRSVPFGMPCVGIGGRLREHLAAVIALMRASEEWGAFMRSLDRALRKYEETIPLALSQ